MRQKRVTHRQTEVFNFMADFYERNDEIPPMWAIAKHFGWASANAAMQHVDALFRHGLLERNEIGNWRFARKLKEAA
jgi:SOS-response transcriptional repressor LexA